jgi:GntR family transcriptional regulator
VRTTRYRAIAEELRLRIEDGNPVAGRLLPSESAMSAEFATSRVTVRRALELLRDDGLVDSRQGLGWYVAAEPVRQPLARLETIEEQIAATGASNERRILEFGFVEPPSRVRQILGPGRTLEVIRLNLADGEPFARVTVWCPEKLGASLSRDEVEASSFYDLLSISLGGAEQTIGAAAASDDDAALLGVPPGSPVLVCERITRDRERNPVLVSEHVFPAHLTMFAVELPNVGRSEAPSGLRLVK